MSRTLKLVLIALAVVALVTFVFASTAFAAGPRTGNCTGDGKGSCGNCSGPGLMHQYGQVTTGAGYGEPGDGTGPGLMRQYGQKAAIGVGYGEPSDGTGPGDMHQWGRV